MQTDQTIIFNFENTFEEQFWIIAVAINEIPADPALEFDCDLNTDESETQFYAIKTIGNEGLADLVSVYNGANTNNNNTNKRTNTTSTSTTSKPKYRDNISITSPHSDRRSFRSFFSVYDNLDFPMSGLHHYKQCEYILSNNLLVLPYQIQTPLQSCEERTCQT